MWVRKQELEALSSILRRAIDGESVEFRDNQEGALSLLKNDLHTLVAQLGAERDAANAARLEFAEYMENISHQLKTPVTSMMLMADLLESAPPERQEEFLTNIRMSLARMDWLVDTLLKLAKLDAGAVHFEQQAVTARELLDAALAPLAILLDVQDQQVTLTDDGILHCDRRWTVEALTNLLKNACEASPAGSTIVVDCGDNPLYEWLSVRDAGAGLSRAEMASLFVRFASSASKNGVGIGLPLALAIVRGQHGDIDVDAGGQGTGAAFTMKFYQ